jgi:hypothetical protein
MAACKHVLKAILAIALVTACCRAYAAPPKFFVVVRGVDEGEGVHSGVVDEARQLFIAELGRRPELTLTPPAGVEKMPDDPEAFQGVLRAHKMKAIELTLRILEAKASFDPPPPGKSFHQLKRSIRLSVFGTTLPDKVMAIGGDGDAAIAADERKNEDAERDGKDLALEATKAAIVQAVDMTVAKLKLPAGAMKVKKKK